MHWFTISLDHLIQSLELSKQSGIQIWDYLCIIPLCSEIEVIFSCNEQFEHNTFQSLGVKIENPLKEWLVL